MKSKETKHFMMTYKAICTYKTIFCGNLVFAQSIPEVYQAIVRQWKQTITGCLERGEIIQEKGK